MNHGISFQVIENGVKIFHMRNEKGQAAIFVALMFNVLFVFFAMSINMALVVHDKINLQNSVDMAAYYAAAKQAELLNVIAHENYMIRQSWKVLSWRYRDLGTLGLYQAPSPIHPALSNNLNDQAYAPAGKAPSLCVDYNPQWVEVPPGQNLCNTENLQIPPLPQVQVIAGFLGINAGIAALSQQLRDQFNVSCSTAGAYNWWFGMSILQAFREDQRNRKLVIEALAKNLSSGNNGDFIDLDGNSVLAGAKATFMKNLTFQNRQAFEASGAQFQMLNSLAGVDYTKWLVEVDIVPELIYSDAQNPDGCNLTPTPISSLPSTSYAQGQLLTPYESGGFGAANLEPWRQESVVRDADYQYSIGFEKNPWYMAYVGVKATATPKEIFFPMGNGVPMVARAFAKPFGGRIGPWYRPTWNNGDSMSSGNSKTDNLMAPRIESNGFSDVDDPTRLPNYSRYPGDTLGMSSALALNGIVGLSAMKSHFTYYLNVAVAMAPGQANDPLAWDASNPVQPPVRNFEISIAAPDLFDVTYYSIEPDFYKNYLNRLQTNAAALGIPSTVPIRADLGASLTTPNFSVQDQMNLAQTQNLQRPEAYFFIRNKTHLLTAWLPGPGAFNYDINGALTNFGKCSLPDDGLKFTNPGSCIAGGGRTGYSVKLVSRDALLSSQHKIGGTGGAAGPILNPPKASDGW